MAHHVLGRRGAACAVALAFALALAPLCPMSTAAAVAAVSPDPPAPDEHASALVTDQEWVWPAAAFRLERPYVAPPHRFAGGHRGVDLRPIGDASLRAPADGRVAFSGNVADRGILTIDHGNGLVTTLEPITSTLEPGAPVARGDRVGTLALGGHAAPGTVHFGVRLDGEYVNPLLLLGGVARAVLLPCC